MLNPEAAGGGDEGAATLPQLSSAGDGVLMYKKAWKDWFGNTAEVGNKTNFATASVPVSAAASSHIVGSRGATKEVGQNSVHSGILSGTDSVRTTGRAFATEEVQRPLEKTGKAVVGADKVKRWDNHKKDTCKCAVCKAARGELKSSWYKHDQLNCPCAVCKQSRGESKSKRGLGKVGEKEGLFWGKPSSPSMPATRTSWLSSPQPSVECWACSRELLRYGGGQPEKPSTFAPSHQHTTFPSCNNVLNSSFTTLPIRPESSTTTGIPIPWQQKLTNLAKGHTDCYSVRGIAPISSSLFAPTPRCASEHICERLMSEQRLGCSYRPEYVDAEQNAFQTNLFTKPRCSRWPSTNRAFSTNFTGSSSDVVQHCTSDCVNLRRSCGYPGVSSCNCCSRRSWQNTVNRCQDVDGTSTGLYNAESRLPETNKLNVQFAHAWESAKETSPAVSSVTERDGHWSAYPNFGNTFKTEPIDVRILPDRMLSLGQNSSLFGGHASSTVYEQPDATSHSAMYPEMDFKPVYVPLQSSNSPGGFSGASSSVPQFPFGLEVQAEADHDIYQPGSHLQAPLHTRSVSFNFDEGTTESSSPPRETTSTTSILNDKDNCSPVMDVDSGDILRSSRAIPEGGLGNLMAHTRLGAGAQARDQQTQPGYDKGSRRGKPARQNFSKRLADPNDSHFTVQQKRAKKEGPSQALPKWCRRFHSKFDHITIIRKIYIRSRVPKRGPESPLTKGLEPTMRKDEKNCNAGTPTLAAQGSNVKGRSLFEESVALCNLQSAGATNVREAVGAVAPPRKEACVVPEKSIEEQRKTMRHGECTGESRNGNNCFESSSETEAEDGPRDMKIRKLNCYGKVPERLGLQCAVSVVQRTSDIHDEVREVEVPPFLSESLDGREGLSMMDLSSNDRKTKRSDVCAIDDHSGKAVQLEVPLNHNVLADIIRGLRGTKRSRTGVEICSEGRESPLDRLRHLIPQLEDKYLLQPLKKRCRGLGATMDTFAPCNDVQPFFKVDPARSTNLNSKTLKLTIEVPLPESMKAYYLTKILLARTPELTVRSIDLVRCMANQSPSLFTLHSHALDRKEHSSLCPTTQACPAPLHMPCRAVKSYLCPKTTGLVPKMLRGTGIYYPNSVEEEKRLASSKIQLELSDETIVFGTRPRLDEELLRRVWHLFSANKGFLLPHDRLTFHTENLLRHTLFDGIIAGASSSLRTSSKYCVYSLLRNIDPDVDLGGTKLTQERRTAFEQHQHSVMQEIKLIPLRNILVPNWIDKPLNCDILFFFPAILLKMSPPRLLSSSAVDMCSNSRDQDRTPTSKQPTQYSTWENLDDIHTERRHREQIYSNGAVAQGCTSTPVNVVKTGVHNLRGHEETHASPAFTGRCNTKTQPISLQTPQVNSFQDLLISVDNSAASPLSNNCKSRTDSKGGPYKTFSSENSRSIPVFGVLECQSELRNDGPTSSALTPSADSISMPIRRRGCPKGGWPKKKLDSSAKDPVKHDKYSLRSVCREAAAVDSTSLKKGRKAKNGMTKMERAEDLRPAPPLHHETTSQPKADVEADIEVIHPTNIRSSKRQDSEFKIKLKTFLERPFQLQELKDLEGFAFLRKPLLRLRETRHRVLHVPLKKEGMSYLDHHPDLARKVADAAAAPEERLRLLRGFFFWLQHSCIAGSYKPWAPDFDEVEESDDDDCVEIPKERFANQVNYMVPEAKSTAERKLHLRDQTNVVDPKPETTNLTARTRGWKRKSVSQPTESTFVSTQRKLRMETTVKRERR